MLRRTFELSAACSGQLLSLTKMVGQLQDAGNTTTLSDYLDLLDQSGMVCGLQKFAMNQVRRRASVPKYQVYNNALLSFYSDYDFAAARNDHKLRGRFFESAVGAHIINCAYTGNFHVFYWRDGNDEVDFVPVRNSRIVAIEVKSNDIADTAGLHRFAGMGDDAARVVKVTSIGKVRLRRMTTRAASSPKHSVVPQRKCSMDLYR